MFIFVDQALIQDDIISVLNPLTGAVPVEPFPDNPKTYAEDLMSSALGVVLVGMHSFSIVAATEDEDSVEHNVRINLLGPGLGGVGEKPPIFALTKTVCIALHRTSKEIGGELYKYMIIRGREIGFRNGLWEHVIDLHVQPKILKRR
jgi:hypothetical protein